ncbi:MAG: Type 2 DNA topoisomerase 6 subunit B [Candidatus Bathyarchaeota archaeon BA1]|nr:MAG: Type 2 DNA topoisomerase 6 subunit B [Candidatus Bathyarchaeota archaeon BA1]
MENALDASDLLRVPPEIYIRLSYEGEAGPEAAIYKLRVEDNGSGVPARHIPSAFGQVLFGSKFKLRQARGTFGLGGKMAILYGQITTHKPAYVASSTGTLKAYAYKMMIDIQRNRPIILDHKIHVNNERWRGTIVEFCLEGDYFRAMPKILEYLKQTAVMNPYANITFVDPKGRLYRFTRVTTKMPPPPKETSPHPHGVDVETIQRLIRITPCKNMLDFMKTHFHRVGETIALRFLWSAGFIETKDPKSLKPEEVDRLLEAMKKSEEFFKEIDVEYLRSLIETTECQDMLDFMRTHFNMADEIAVLRLLLLAGLIKTKDPRKLKPDEIVKLVHMMGEFDRFLPPDTSCLSPIGEELLEAGILKEMKPDFVAVHQRKPSTYSGHPFIVETAIAYGGNVPKKEDIVLYRFANRIPLLYDEASDVSWSIIKEINWRRYKVTPDMPIAVLVHICSTKVPYKTVGKEFIADRPEVKGEILNGIREVARQLQHFLTRREHAEKEKRRLATFSKYLPKIARFSTELSGEREPPDINKLYKRQTLFENYSTTDSYTDSEAFDARPYKTKLIHVYNKHESNAINFKVLGCMEPLKWKGIKPETTLDAGSEAYEMVAEKWAFLKIQVKSASLGNAGTVDVFIDGLSE